MGRTAFTWQWKIAKLKTKCMLMSNANEKQWQQLDFKFISLPSLRAVNWVNQLSSGVMFIFRKYCCCLVGLNFLTMADSLNVFTFPYYVMTAYSFVSGACVCHVLLVSCDAAKVALYFGEHLICRLFYFSQILDGAPYIQKRCVVWKLQDLALFVANREWYSVLQNRHLCTCK